MARKQKKQLTNAEKAANLRERAEKYEAGEVTTKVDLQLPFAEYAEIVNGNIRIIKFPKRVDDVRHFLHVSQGEAKFKVFLRPSKAGAGLPIPSSVRPSVEFPQGIAYKESAPSYFGTISTVCEEAIGASLVIGLCAKELDISTRKNAELEKALAEMADKANKRGK